MDKGAVAERTATAPAEASAQRMSVTALAALKGVSKQTISEKVKRLVAAGSLQTYPGKGREKLVDVAEYERAIGAGGDAARELGFETRLALEPSASERLEPQAHGGALLRRQAAAEPDQDPTYRDASTREKLAKAQIAEIELAERLGRVVPVADVEDAMVSCAGKIVGALDRLQLRAAEMAAAVAKDGEVGARRVIRTMTFELRTAIAEAMSQAAAGDGARVEKIASESLPVTGGAAGEEGERVAA